MCSQLKKLLKIMDEEKPYTNEKLNLTDLSKLLGITNHNLSEIINKKIDFKNLFESHYKASKYFKA